MSEMQHSQSSGMLPEDVVNRVQSLLAAAEQRAIERHREYLSAIAGQRNDILSQMDARFKAYSTEHDSILDALKQSTPQRVIREVRRNRLVSAASLATATTGLVLLALHVAVMAGWAPITGMGW